MKRILVPLIASLLFPLLARAEPACPSLVITGHPDYPPLAWASQGRIVGAGAELVASIATQLGVGKVESKDFGSWEKAQQAARRGRADVIFGIFKTAKREKYLNYIDPPFMLDPIVVVVRNGEGFTFRNWEDLRGRRAVKNAGESYGDRFDAFMAKELTVLQADGVDKAFDALLNKEADYLIIGLYPGRNEARRLGLADRVEFLPGELETAEMMYVAFSKKSKCYAALGSGFAAALKDAVDEGRVKALLDSAEKQLAP